jgi:hypothetical protein
MAHAARGRGGREQAGDDLPSPIEYEESRHSQRAAYFGAPVYSAITGAPSPNELGYAGGLTTPPAYGRESSGLSFGSTQIGSGSAESSFALQPAPEPLLQSTQARGSGGMPVETLASAEAPSRVPISSKSPPSRPSPEELPSAYGQSPYVPGAAQPIDFLAQPSYDNRFTGSTAYDPTAYSTHLIEESPGNRYSERQTLPGGFASTERLTGNAGTESIRSAQTRRSKYDSKCVP